MQVQIIQKTDAGSRLRVTADVGENVARMLSWILMSSEAEIVPVVEAYKAALENEKESTHA
jgi:hypothetical protein